MIVPAIIILGLGASMITGNIAWVTIAALLCVTYHEFVMYDLHGHLYRIEEELKNGE